MVRPRSIITPTCQNKKCAYFEQEKGKDILKRGKNKAGHKRFFCNHCKTWFVETTNTPFYHKHLSKNEIIEICRYLNRGKGIRQIESLTHHHRDTIGHLMDDLAIHAPYVNDFFINEVIISPLSVREMWINIKKYRKSLSRNAKEQIKKILRTY